MECKEFTNIKADAMTLLLAISEEKLLTVFMLIIFIIAVARGTWPIRWWLDEL